jgi:tetratricopeptide (TPR) repeat protein
MDLDPLSLIVMEGWAYISFLRRRYSEAVARYSQIVSKDPSFYKPYTSMGRALFHMGQHARAVEMLEKGLSLGGQIPSILGALGQAYGMAGLRSKAVEVLGRLRSLAAVRAVPSTCFALTHLGLGDTDAALTWLETGVERRESSVVALAIHPAYEELGSEPRFRTLVDRIMRPHDPRVGLSS